ncbi:hypothetical protein PYCCODRAFT_372562 [Trametes coccinea BRFM310]|uniref:Uncharacterized protein n=1 Tax=Trametes coccinea (strain BRFM310) TaxID=1353009 RepID=A0A1Y2J6V5_TRAC3|nr:hypothetical protein PYCCODRAFT_372562 [Trametes coccinea BRFM310]
MSFPVTLVSAVVANLLFAVLTCICSLVAVGCRTTRRSAQVLGAITPYLYLRRAPSVSVAHRPADRCFKCAEVSRSCAESSRERRAPFTASWSDIDV